MDSLERLRSLLAGRYLVEGELGEGGMARVYRARDLRYDRPVAIKVLKPELAMAVGADRFLQEIAIAARFQHPHIVPLFDSGQAEGLLFYVMPFVEGESLRERLKREAPLSLVDACAIAADVAEALAYAHGRGVVHRDIKPANILLTSEHAMVADFGIARALEGAGYDRLSETGFAIGTPEYMSPEQAAGHRSIDARSDLYSLGCVMYEMLSGQPPFSGATPQAVLARQAQERLPSIDIVRPELPDTVVAVLEHTLAKVPADRFGSATELRDAIRRCQTAERIPVRRKPRRLGLAGLLLGSAIAVAAALRFWVLAPAPLDPGRVIVYPLDVQGGGDALVGLGANVSTLIVYALDGLGSLRALRGAALPDSEGATLELARAWTRARGAGFFVTGSAIPHGDSADVMLTLFDTRGDSIVKRTHSRSVPVQETWREGGRAASEFVPYLIPTGGPVDFTAIADRDLNAVANFFEGEAHFRRAEFTTALEHFTEALQADSLLAIAALRGAEAAIWAHTPDEGVRLVLPALQRATWSGARYDEYARGLVHYLSGRADSAVARLERAVALDSTWAWPWQVLGDVYTHLLPRAAPLDSLAEDAFRRAHAVDSAFSPILLHLVEIAARHGKAAEATSLLARFRSSTTDQHLLTMADLMVRCVGDAPAAADWRAAAGADPTAVLNVGYLIAPGGAHFECAKRAFTAVWEDDGASRNLRFLALVGLQGILASQGKWRELRTLLGDVEHSDVHEQAGMLYILDALAGLPFEEEARAAAAGFRSAFAIGAADRRRVWFLGTWEASRGDPREAQRIADTLAAWARAALPDTPTGSARRSAPPPDAVRELSLLARSMAARTALAHGDTVAARRLLAELDPTGGLVAVAYRPWESLAWERLTLAELSLAAGRAEQALQLARNLEAPAPIIYPLYLRWSLDVQGHAAEAVGDARLSATIASKRARIETGTR